MRFMKRRETFQALILELYGRGKDGAAGVEDGTAFD